MVSQELLLAMRDLQREHGCSRVEVQVWVEELAPDGKTKLRNPHSVLYLPNLGWTTKDDIATPGWGDARVLAHEAEVSV